MRDQIISDLSNAVGKVTPVGLVAAASEAGWGVQEWMYAATCLYVVLQAAYLVWKWRREAKAKR